MAGLALTLTATLQDQWWKFASEWFDNRGLDINYPNACCAAVEYVKKQENGANVD